MDSHDIDLNLNNLLSSPYINWRNGSWRIGYRKHAKVYGDHVRIGHPVRNKVKTKMAKASRRKNRA